MCYADGRRNTIQQNDEGRCMCEAGRSFTVNIKGYNNTSNYLILEVEVDGQNTNFVFQLVPRQNFNCEFDGVNVSQDGTERMPFYLAPLQTNTSGSSSEDVSASCLGKIEVSFFKRGEPTAANKHPTVNMKQKFAVEDKKFFEQNGVQTQLLPPTKKPAFSSTITYKKGDKLACFFKYYDLKEYIELRQEREELALLFCRLS
jgi:hypothetical protein